MRVLVIPASRHGGTAEIGRAMARTLRSEGLDVDVGQPDQIFNLSPYDAHIIGSAVYFGQWLESALTFVGDHAEDIRSKPTWLFSSGPFGPGSPDKPLADRVLNRLMEQTGALEHRMFGGRLDLDRLPTADRHLAEWVGAGSTDERDWSEIEAWTRAIARQLVGQGVGG